MQHHYSAILLLYQTYQWVSSRSDGCHVSKMNVVKIRFVDPAFRHYCWCR